MVKNDSRLDQAMQTLAHRDVLDWLTNFIRIQLATQSPTQREFTLAVLEEGLNNERTRFKGYQGSSPSQAEFEVLLYRRAFARLAGDILATMGSGLTMEEATATQPIPLE
nr:hypothetical protein [uncultured Albidiferax sp.]